MAKFTLISVELLAQPGKILRLRENQFDGSVHKRLTNLEEALMPERGSASEGANPEDGGEGGEDGGSGQDFTPGGIDTVNTNEAKEIISQANSVDKLKELLEVETTSPRHEGGRKGVLKAINDRMKELTAE